MADDPRNSPAVKSMLKEQAEQKLQPQKGDLDAALADTFPASDPVSMTSTAISAGRTDAEEADRTKRQRDLSSVNEALPPADQALSSAGAGDDDEAGAEFDPGEIEAPNAEIAKLSSTAVEIAENTARALKSGAATKMSDMRGMINQRPLAAMGIVAAIAFVWGATR